MLRFLRVSKFSQLKALERLEKYLDLFNIMPDWLRDIDMMDPKIQAFIDTGSVEAYSRLLKTKGKI